MAEAEFLALSTEELAAARAQTKVKFQVVRCNHYCIYPWFDLDQTICNLSDIWKCIIYPVFFKAKPVQGKKISDLYPLICTELK